MAVKLKLPQGRSRYLAGGGALLLAAVVYYGSWEGTRYTAYQDSGGVWTICEGLTGPWVHKGLVMTAAECDVKYKAAILEHEAGLLACAPELADPKRVPDKTYVAINDWAYNVGTGAACKSTLIKLVKAGDIRGACGQLSKWVYVNGRVLAGLVKRRVTGDVGKISERDLCVAELP
jgi:lysozyme